MATIANTPSAPSSPTIVSQIESFAIFAIVILALGAFEKTHMIAVFLLGFLALVIVLNYANGAYK